MACKAVWKAELGKLRLRNYVEAVLRRLRSDEDKPLKKMTEKAFRSPDASETLLGSLL